MNRSKAYFDNFAKELKEIIEQAKLSHKYGNLVKDWYILELDLAKRRLEDSQFRGFVTLKKLAHHYSKYTTVDVHVRVEKLHRELMKNRKSNNCESCESIQYDNTI